MGSLLDLYNKDPKAFRFRSRVRDSKPVLIGRFLNHGVGDPSYASLEHESALCLDQVNQRTNGKFLTGQFFGLDRYKTVRIPGPATSKSYYWNGTNRDLRYEGLIVPDLPPIYVSRYGDSPFENAARSIYDSEVTHFGAEALSKSRPDNPLFDLSTAIGELKDLPSSLRQRFLIGKRPLKSIADLGLAYQFGWAPLFRDVRDLVLNSFNLNKAANQLIANEGRPVRRYRLLRSSTVSIDPVRRRTYGAAGSLPVTTDFYPDLPSHTDTASVTDRVWTTSVFVYRLPGGPRTDLWTYNLYRKLLGVELSPKVVYNLVPWSFLADYFTSLGDYVDAVAGSSTVEELSVLNAFVMRHKKFETKRSCNYTLFNGRDVIVSGSNSSSIVYESKRRGVIDPTNPGLEVGKNLTDSQLGILGLLGLSRL